MLYLKDKSYFDTDAPFERYPLRKGLNTNFAEVSSNNNEDSIDKT